MWASRPFVEFWDPRNISETVDGGNITFGIQMEGSEYQRKQ